MTDYSLQVRRLALSTSGKGVMGFFSIAAAIILAALGVRMYRRHQANEAAKRVAELEKNKELFEKNKELEKDMEIVVEIPDESTKDSMDEMGSTDEMEDLEIAPTELEEVYDRSVSLCRTGTRNSLDVHACASGSCDVCQKDMEPDFLGVKKLAPGTEGRIKWLRGKWWEIEDTERPKRLETIMSPSHSANAEREEE